MTTFQTFIVTLLLSLTAIAHTSLSAADTKLAIEDATRPPEPITNQKDNSLVTVLGYHDFSDSLAATEMRLPVDKFRVQMDAIKTLGYKVISLEEFLSWKNGSLILPERSVLITIDDGWKTVYTDAYPVLKEFGYPFTLFLYKDYVDGGGKALTSAMIKEMMANGASIGSHSVTHSYPKSVKAEQLKGPESYTTFLNTEFGDSKKFLETQFESKVTTYAYPGGFHTPEMFEVAADSGYMSLFTVLPGKVTKDSANMTLPRYIILGTHDSIFEKAMSFPATATSPATLGSTIQTTPYPVTPVAGATIGDRLPTISVDFSALDQLDPQSLVMRISGFAKVPAVFDPESKKFSWKVNRRLRKPTCDITVSWKLQEFEKYEKPMSWTFILNRRASYLPTTAPSLPARPIDESPSITE